MQAQPWNLPVAKHPSKLDLGDYLPYLVNRVGTIIADQFGAEALAPHGLSIAMWRVIAVLASTGQQRQIDLAELTSTDASTLSRLVTLIRTGRYAHPIGEQQPRSRGQAFNKRADAGGASHSDRTRLRSRGDCRHNGKRACCAQTLPASDVRQYEEQGCSPG